MSIFERKRVFVLGAGASRGLHSEAPLNSELLPGALALIDEEPKQREIQYKRLRELREFIYDLYPKSATDDNNLPLIEDLLTLLDIAILDHRALSEEYPARKVKDLRDDLVYAICEILTQRLDGSGKTTNMGLAINFVGLRPNDSIISLNYDLIIDDAILDRTDIPDYGIVTRGQNQRPESIPLYKLHGSLNWLFCPWCEEVHVTDYFKSAHYCFVDSARVKCPDCQRRLEPLLILPTFLKAYDNQFLNQIWQKAETRLSEADEIIIVGYSLPDSDVVLRSLFTRALFTNRKRGQGCCAVIVVNKVDTTEDIESVRQAYVRVFGEVDLDPTGFSAYIERGCKTPHQLEILNKG